MSESRIERLLSRRDTFVEINHESLFDNVIKTFNNTIDTVWTKTYCSNWEFRPGKREKKLYKNINCQAQGPLPRSGELLFNSWFYKTPREDPEGEGRP